MTGRGFTRTALAAFIALGGTSSPARAEERAVTVVEVAGDVAYVTPGGDAGIAAGDRVQLAGGLRLVLETTAATAAVKLEGATVAIGAAGSVTITPPGTGATAPLHARAAVRPLDAWRAQWPDAIRPATLQHPAPAPLGGGPPPGTLHAALVAHGHGVVDRSGPAAWALELRGTISAEPWRDRPLGLDLDVAGRVYGDGRAGARTPILVRRAQVRWGPAADPQLALGRLAWAAEAVGLLDGARLSRHLGALEIAGFGGVVPDPVDGRPDTAASRFGGEVIWDRPLDAWRPRLALTALASTWDGALDERRLIASAEVDRDAFTLAGWGEAQGFAADNPWGAPAVQLTGAGAGLTWRQRGRRASVDVTFQRPERSLRLTTAPPLVEDGWWLDTTASAGTGGARWSLDGTATLGTTHGDGRFIDAGALVLGELRVLPRATRLQLGVTGGRTHFLDWYGLELGVAVPARRRWDLAARYRPELMAYTGALDRFLSHTVAVDARWTLSSSLDLTAATLATLGEDRDALAVFATVAWRPLP